jgi:metallo-beta-lactamase family protein
MRGDKQVKIFRQEYEVKASVNAIRSMSAHGDYDDLCQFLACQDKDQVKTVFLVHGEYDVQIDFQHKLRKKGFKDVEIPRRHQLFRLD